MRSSWPCGGGMRMGLKERAKLPVSMQQDLPTPTSTGGTVRAHGSDTAATGPKHSPLLAILDA